MCIEGAIVPCSISFFGAFLAGSASKHAQVVFLCVFLYFLAELMLMWRSVGGGTESRCCVVILLCFELQEAHIAMP